MTENIFRSRQNYKQSVQEEAQGRNQAQIIPRFGPLPSFPNQRLWARIVSVICAFIIVYFYSTKNKETIFASQKNAYQKLAHNIQCSDSFKNDISKHKGCVPRNCGRAVFDTLVNEKEVEILLNVAKAALALGKPENGVSILNLHSGQLSYGPTFVNFYKLPEWLNVFKIEHHITYLVVLNKIQQAIAHHFGIQGHLLHVTYPTFFSRLTSPVPKTTEDKYWHEHIDKEPFKYIHYISLLYLTDYKKDFFGGRFAFVNTNNSTSIVEPRKGRVFIFTSGAENPHFVEKVISGERYAINIAFTCDSFEAAKNLKVPSQL